MAPGPASPSEGVSCEPAADESLSETACGRARRKAQKKKEKKRAQQQAARDAVPLPLADSEPDSATEPAPAPEAEDSLLSPAEQGQSLVEHAAAMCLEHTSGEEPSEPSALSPPQSTSPTCADVQRLSTAPPPTSVLSQSVKEEPPDEFVCPITQARI